MSSWLEFHTHWGIIRHNYIIVHHLWPIKLLHLRAITSATRNDAGVQSVYACHAGAVSGSALMIDINDREDCVMNYKPVIALHNSGNNRHYRPRKVGLPEQQSRAHSHECNNKYLRHLVSYIYTIAITCSLWNAHQTNIVSIKRWRHKYDIYIYKAHQKNFKKFQEM